MWRILCKSKCSSHIDTNITVCTHEGSCLQTLSKIAKEEIIQLCWVYLFVFHNHHSQSKFVSQSITIIKINVKYFFILINLK